MNPFYVDVVSKRQEAEDIVSLELVRTDIAQRSLSECGYLPGLGISRDRRMNRSPGVNCNRESRAPISRFERNRGRALELFATEGFGQVSMRRLASHLDLSAGSLYNHCASKEELLLEFIEEHYAGLLAVLDGHRGSKISLQLIARRLVELHDQSPMHFQVATRDIVCLRPAQRLQIEILRQQLRKKIEDSMKVETSIKNSPTAQPLLELFEHLPLWLSRYPLEVSQRCKVLEQLLVAAL